MKIGATSINWLLLLLLCWCSNHTAGGSFLTFAPIIHRRNGFRFCGLVGTKPLPLPTAGSSSSSARVTVRSRTISLFLADQKNEEVDDDNDDDTACMTVLAQGIATTLIKSDAKRDTGFDGASTGWTSWIDGDSAVQLQHIMDRVQLQQQQSSSWWRWIKSCPTHMMIEFSPFLRNAVRDSDSYKQTYAAAMHAAAIEEDASAGDSSDLETDDDDDDAATRFLSRLGMRCIYLPSGETLAQPLRTAPGAMVYGRLLWGGVTRFRLIGGGGGSSPRRKQQRRAGERTVIQSKVTDKEDNDDDTAELSWLQYGGPERNYQAVDMGPCLLLEITLLPIGLELPLLNDNEDKANVAIGTPDMIVSSPPWNPREFLSLQAPKKPVNKTERFIRSTSKQTSMIDICDMETSFCSTVGGLQPQINEIVRRVLDGRVVQPVRRLVDTSSENQTTSSSTRHQIDEIRRQEMEGLLSLGLRPVQGLLLHGPPGCGKTHLAREISTILDARSPKIVAAPELLDRWVGGTERMVRELFADAEYELNQICGGDATKSALHVIVVDEIDAVFRKRSAADGTSEVTRASAVNQILSKLDGIQSLGNILFIGMTNRRELLDPALLRPGRLEVQIEIPKPKQEERRQILKIHFGALRERGRLSQPLCNAIDGSVGKPSDGRRVIWLRPTGTLHRPMIRDLAADRWTGGFSGADLAGLVRNAGSIALARSRVQGGGVEGLLITLDDVKKAIAEVQE